MKKLKKLLPVAILLAFALPPAARADSRIPELGGMFPQNAGEFAYANLRQARNLPWFPQLQEQMLPKIFRQFVQSLASAGVDTNLQVEELAWALVPTDSPEGAAQNTTVRTRDQVVGVALGPFWREKTEAYFKAHNLTAVTVREYSLYAVGGDLYFCFLDSNTAAFGQRKGLEKLIAVRYGEEQSLLSNTELAPLISHANGSSLVWAALSARYARLAMPQLVPQTAEFPQAQELAAKLRALTIEIGYGHGIQTNFEALCESPDDANTLAALLQAGLFYEKSQVGSSNPDLAAMLGNAGVARWGDRLDVTLELTDDQVVGLIHRDTFAMSR
jgi:hypothetical protein